MTVLSPDLRSVLEKAVVAARDAAEATCREALSELGVEAERAGEHLSDDDRQLRLALRAEARQLGGFDRLVEESAYEQWHRMLFARFLAENDLLIHPEHRVAVSLADCEEIAHGRGHSDPWVVASEFASAMLPGIFRSDDPVLQVRLAPEGQQRLELTLAELPPEIFTSEDGLGWVYQYWQSKKKKEVNASERKIGGADIAPVTQLFTENYMVRFLLENTLGAWWAARHPGSQLVEGWTYLRFDDESRPAAGSFSGWPETVAEVTMMDPCCGSGHFLVVAFEMLRQMRMEAEALSAAEAGDAVVRDNLFGLELDPRCTQIAAFALALQAWKTGGYRQLPIPNIACSGISAKGHLEDWQKLARGDERLERSLERLHALFRDAADLGSLIDPLRESDGDLLAAQFEEVAPLLREALGSAGTAEPGAAVFGAAVADASRAASLLARQYTLVSTNVPYLGREKQSAVMRRFAESRHANAKHDLATIFVSRIVESLTQDGTAALVLPQYWLFLSRYAQLRRDLLRSQTWDVLAPLGPGAFDTISGEVVNTCLVLLSRAAPEDRHEFCWLDALESSGTAAKADYLQRGALEQIRQSDQLKNPDAVIGYVADGTPLLSEYAYCYQGLATSDNAQFVFNFWEVPSGTEGWHRFHFAPSETRLVSGCSHILFFEDGHGRYYRHAMALKREGRLGGWQSGHEAWGKRGVAINRMGDLPASLYLGEKFDCNVAMIVPYDEADLPALWLYCSSSEYSKEVRRINKKLSVTNATLAKVPFDQPHWRAAAQRELPGGVPEPESDDPVQWVFHGRVRQSSSPLQVAVSRLLGHRWLAQSEDGLADFGDDDGIVCIPTVRGERPAAERLRALLAAAFTSDWSPAREADLLSEAGYAGRSLEQWLRDGFFEQHCEVFHQRPFVWQIWDGRKDGFSALVNYHSLDRASLEKLIYTYLGDWIRVQRAEAAAGTAGADLRLAAAQELQRTLELILEGGPPYDIFVRWKPIEEQPVGWEPDLNDGVRLNIRPFVTAGVLRKNPKIKWNKDRGKDLESAPWYHLFKGDRINDHHLALAEKRAARERASRKSA